MTEQPARYTVEPEEVRDASEMLGAGYDKPLYIFFYNPPLPLLRITRDKKSIALQVGPHVALFLEELVRLANLAAKAEIKAER
jgi:hypothetical protein